MELTRTPAGMTVLNDAYNANPESVAAALDALSALEIPAGARRVAVLGPMAELGAAGPAAHRAIGERAARLGVDTLVLVGDDAGAIAEGFGPGDHTVRVDDPVAAVAALAARLAPGDAVLVKASRIAGLETVARALLGAPAVPEPAS
jgi:UDP-N-acetylmuramoyl-tripeptide--D-alanyl-D-alanine ligase